MRTVLVVLSLALWGAYPSAQRELLPSSTFQHVSVSAGPSAITVIPGGSVSLWVDVSPKPNIHVYAPGAKDFQAVALVVSPERGVTVGKISYPAGTPTAFPGIDARVPVYQKTFRITVPLTIARTSATGRTLNVAGAVNYQACDDRVCFPPASAAVNWTVKVEAGG